MSRPDALRRRHTQDSRSQSQETEDVEDHGSTGRQSIPFTYPNYSNVNQQGAAFGIPPGAFPYAGLGPNWQSLVAYPGHPTHNMQNMQQSPMPVPPSHQSQSVHKLSADSNATLFDPSDPITHSRSSLSSSKYPFGLEAPTAAFNPGTWPRQSQPHAWSVTSAGDHTSADDDDLEKLTAETCRLPRRRRGYLANVIDLYNLYDNTDDNALVSKKRDCVTQAANARSRLVDPLAYDDEQLLDQDDPLLTGVKKKCLDDMDDIDQNARRQLSYKERREEQQRVRIEFNICCMSLLA